MPDGMVHNVYYKNFSGVGAAGMEGLVFWFLFVKLDAPTHEFLRYTESDISATLAKYGDYNFGDGYTFNDLWESRVQGGMVPMEEGMVKAKWNNGGRVVLMGDAMYKVSKRHTNKSLRENGCGLMEAVVNCQPRARSQHCHRGSCTLRQ